MIQRRDDRTSLDNGCVVRVQIPASFPVVWGAWYSGQWDGVYGPVSRACAGYATWACDLGCDYSGDDGGGIFLDLYAGELAALRRCAEEIAERSDDIDETAAAEQFLTWNEEIEEPEEEE